MEEIVVGREVMDDRCRRYEGHPPTRGSVAVPMARIRTIATTLGGGSGLLYPIIHDYTCPHLGIRLYAA